MCKVFISKQIPSTYLSNKQLFISRYVRSYNHAWLRGTPQCVRLMQ